MMNTYPLLNVSGFNLFQPRPEDLVNAPETLARRLKKNQDFVEATPLPRPHHAITGSFIYAHAPDYVGSPTVTWTKSDWLGAFRKLIDQGIDTVIFQASVWNELGEVFYPSQYFKTYKMWPVVPPMLEAARECKLKVFLGGYGSVSGWSQLDDAAIANEIERQTQCFTELLQWQELFDGIYYSPETAFHGHRDCAHEAALNRIYRVYINRLKDLAPDKQILMSPGSSYTPGMAEDFIASWQAILADVPLDILSPQDSIGCGGCLLTDQAAMWQLWHQVAAARQVELWANIELFERQTYGGPTPFVTASAERIQHQCANVTPYVQKCVCWEALYFDLAGK